MSPSNTNLVMSGWLYKTCRFSLLHSLKERYFVLIDRELRYYKQPDDTQPLGVINLKNLVSVKEHSTTQHHHTILYGLSLITTHDSPQQQQQQHHTLPILFTSSKQSRQEWINKIQSTIDRIKYYDCSSRCCYTNENDLLVIHKRRDEDVSVLDKWLDKLNLLYDEDKSDACCRHCHVSPVLTERNNSSSTSINSKRSSSGKSTPISLENSSLESLLQVGYFLEEEPEQIDNTTRGYDTIQHKHYHKEDHYQYRYTTSTNTTTSTTTTTNTNNKRQQVNKKQPAKSVLKQRQLYANITTHSNDFDSKPIIPLSPRPLSSSNNAPLTNSYFF